MLTVLKFAYRLGFDRISMSFSEIDTYRERELVDVIDTINRVVNRFGISDSDFIHYFPNFRENFITRDNCFDASGFFVYAIHWKNDFRYALRRMVFNYHRENDF